MVVKELGFLKFFIKVVDWFKNNGICNFRYFNYMVFGKINGWGYW